MTGYPKIVAPLANPPKLATLVLMASVGPLAMNIFLPSLPTMSRHFNVDYSVIQLLISLYLVALAVVQLFIGPASDRYGRRPVLLICFSLFCVATVAAIYSPSFQVLLGWRLLQSLAAAGIVLSRAIVRDVFAAEDLASKIAYITMGMSLTPMVAPFIGGYLDESFGWQASFWFAFVCGLVAVVVLWFDLEETNLTPSASMRAQFRAYPELMRSPRFWGYTATASFASATFFSFLGGGPYVSTEMLHMSPSQYGIYFGIASLGYMVGNFLSGRFTRAWGMNRMMMLGNIVGVVGMLLSLALFSAGYYHPISLFGPASLVGVGNGMALPSANAGIVSVRPHLAGSASGLGGSLMIAGGALAAAMASSLLDPTTGPYPLIYVALGAAILGVIAAYFVIRRTAQVGELQ
jgi:DHA1 family bicyclomycin/chloramphenicol resistance-like MFS transporter